MQKHDKDTLLHNARPVVTKIVKEFGDAQVEYFNPPTIFAGHCSSWLLVLPLDEIGFGTSPVPFFRRNRQLCPYFDIFKGIFSIWKSKIPQEVYKSSNQRWTILWLIFSFNLFWNKCIFTTKNAPNLFVLPLTTNRHWKNNSVCLENRASPKSSILGEEWVQRNC